ELTMSFDPATGRLTPAGTHRAEPNGAVVASLPGGRFRFDPPDAGASLRPAWDKAADRLRGVFKEAAKDGAVERKQLERQPAAQALFDLADRNADKKVGAAEVE